MRLFAPTTAALIVLLTLSGCPELPDKSVSDASTADGETFIPLEVFRLFDSVGEPQGGERITIYGAGFTRDATVLFGEELGDNVLMLNDGELNVTVPPGTAGKLVDVSVHLPDGQHSTIKDGYLYRGPLELTSISPATSPVGGGVEVTVVGIGFTDQTRILVGGRLLEGMDRVDDQTITGRVPACLRSEAGFVDVIATNGFEQRVLTRAFEYQRALVLDGLSPIAGTSDGGTIVTLRGSGFDTEMAVRFDDVPAEIVSVATDRASAEVRTPPGRHGVVDVDVGRASERSVLEQAWFYVDADIVSGSSLWAGHAVPAVGPAAGGNLVTVSVVGLQGTGGVSATFNGVPADVMDVQPGQSFVVLKAPPLDGDAPASAQIVIRQSSQSAPAVPYGYEKDLTISAFDPPFVGTGGGRTNIIGSGLKSSATVTIGGKAATVIDMDGGKLRISAPGGAPGKVDVELIVDGRRVFVPGGFEYRSDDVHLWAVDPGDGAQAGGRIMRIFGEGFQTSPPSPKFGDNPVEGVDLVDDRLAIVRLPRGDVGHVNVRSDGSILAMALEYFDPRQRYTSTGGGTIPEALNVTVVDYFTGEGVPNAFVILWDDLDTPFQGLTDDRGQITFSDVAFGPNQMVTAGADEYTTGTICDFDARDTTLRLIPLNPSNPGNGGGGGPGPQPMPDSILRGRVTGIDKYIIVPPGSCDARLEANEAPGVLCEPCTQDADCGGEGALCTPLGQQGGRCSIPCETAADCPDHYMCVGVGGGAVQCLPDSGVRAARCQTTVADVFTLNPVALTPTDSDGDYDLQMQPGEYAVVCIGGYEDTVSHEFIATAMGVRRHVFAAPGETIPDQDIDLDIPLTRNLRIRLDGAPVGHFETERHTVKVFIDLGSDGVFQMPQEDEGTDQNVFELKGFPVEFAESMYDASFTVFARAIANRPDTEQTGEGSFVNHTGIDKVFDDAVFDLDFDSPPVEGSSAHHQRTGIRDDIFAMHGPAANGELPERIYAVGKAGHVLAFDGTLWGIQQTPTENTLRGVWAAATDDVWAVGDRSTVMRWDGLRWLPVPMPAEVTSPLLDWWGVEGDGAGTLWMWGTHGVWRRDVDGNLVKIGSELTPGSVEDIHAVSADEAWLVGKGGLIRRWRSSAPTQLERWDRSGDDLHAVHGAAGDRVWAVGERGRIMRWDGAVWFDLLPVTRRGLWDVFAVSADEAWIAGDAGEVLGWDGDRWRIEETIPHADLRGIGMTANGRMVTAGLATLIIGPFMQIPQAANPTVNGELADLNLRFLVDEGADASFVNMTMLHSSGFPFWDIIADGKRTNVPLPDLERAWGLQPIWPGDGGFNIWRVYVPGFDMGHWDESVLSVYRWRSWAAKALPLSIPEQPQ